ncbi:MAG: hypothetical protein FJ276_01900 [Planctomycetes bacterium]|nr:hypothetical protein [Planctomycetota bacterium]
MTERSDLLKRLQDLRELSVHKKCQLTKAEQEEIRTVLSALCAADTEGYRASMEALADFPAEVGATLLADAWSALIGAQFPVPRDLREAKFNTDLGKRLRISLAQRLLAKDQDSALRVLLDVCMEMKPAKKPIPTSKDLELLRTALLEPSGQSLGRLPLANAMGSQVSILTAHLLAAAFLHKKSQKPLPPQLQLAIIRWANGCPKLGQPTPEVANAIVQAVKTWDGDFRAILAKEVGMFQGTLRDVLASAGCTGSDTEKTQTAQTTVASSPADATAELRSPRQPAQYDALYEIERIGKYVQNLEGQIKQHRQKIQTAERDWQQAHSELEIARREREDARRQASVEHDSATRLAGEKSELHKEAESLQSEIDRLREQLRAAESRHEQAVASHSEQLNTLSERIAREGEHWVGAFRNRIGARVQKYADDLKNASDMPMTDDLGKAIRNQMKQLLWILKSDGVKINGDF